MFATDAADHALMDVRDDRVRTAGRRTATGSRRTWLNWRRANACSPRCWTA
jgi:hypothetical protein